MSIAPMAQGRALSPLLSRVVSRGALKFVAVVAAGWLLWPAIGRSFEEAFQAVASAALGGLEYGDGGHADFLPIQVRSSRAIDQDGSWDARVRLRIDGVEKAHTVVVNPRRLAYLPLLVVTASVVAMGLALRRTLAALILGFAVTGLVAIVSVYVTVAWLFARVPGLVYAPNPTRDTALHVLYEGFVTPIANKFIVSVLLALLCARLVRKLGDEGAGLSAVAARAKTSAPASTRVRPTRRKRKR